MPTIMGQLNMSGGRVRNLIAAVNPDEPMRRAESVGLVPNTIIPIGAGVTPAVGLGLDGDWALDSVNGRLWGPKAGGSWPGYNSIKGPAGTNGTNGVNGFSAYQVAVSAGFVGTQAEWLDSLVGPQGDTGPGGSWTARRIQNMSDTSAGAITCTWNAYDEIRMILTAPTTLTFSGAADGQGCVLKLIQDATAGRVVTLPANVRYNELIDSFANNILVGDIDKLGFTYDEDDNVYDLVSVVPRLG